MQFLGILLLGVLQASNGPVCVAATPTTEGNVPSPTVEFESLPTGTNNSSVLVYPPYTFRYKANTNISTEYVRLFNDTTPILDSSFPSGPVNLSYTERSSVTGYNWEIALSGTSGPSYTGAFLFFEVSWNTTRFSGTSYSGVFTYGDDLLLNYSRFQIGSAYKSETTTPLFINATATESQMALTAQSTAATASTATMASGSSNTSSSVGRENTSSHKSLRGGAIAGIVVGVVVGLAVILGLVWLFFRRRQRINRGYSSPHHSRSIGPGVGVSVVAHPGDDATVSVGVGADIGIDVGAAAAASVAAEKSRVIGVVSSDSERNDGANSPYTDDIDSVADSHIGAPAISSHVAALIEDGMTAEDVARLAAEEIELDAAIQNASQGRTAEATAHQ
ncbi:hypothetical protein CMQ_7879 [Grosmannia clavigera kw1407]|uniref:Mid2 domain-containing protein n=1 Tax=Grosmannia clavigera (strain kw1407 / UAMH 11150) TaxID=655863 RepID=F0XSD1_GROCL|nr:uncharacterized protein CMQ_7879 [Grosmannia clavigera kw1407]EFW99511.1 hypothetical protein CMQ_7879 [Grosmannia clavigera kw1407]